MTADPTALLYAPAALLPDGMAEGVVIRVGADGAVAGVEAGVARPPADAVRLPGTVLPGMPNLHSHAFQRAMAGLTERADHFWSWRDVMYRFAGAMTPELAGAVAQQLYVEMLEQGYTAVCEFHYLHHQADGTPYDDRAELSAAMIGAAQAAGIGITHLPVLYECETFGGGRPGGVQRRFLDDADGILALVGALRGRHAGDPGIAVGIAPHSIRTVTEAGLRAAVDGITAMAPDAPIHLHVAETAREVQETVAWHGRRPTEWLLDNFAIDRRYCFVHATRVTAQETAGLAASGAVAGICTTTEGNLGDGIFPLGPFLAGGGSFGVGSDSHVSTGPVEELRWLEYGQRLVSGRRGTTGPLGGGPRLRNRRRRNHRNRRDGTARPRPRPHVQGPRL